jgi:hypothetical protein
MPKPVRRGIETEIKNRVPTAANIASLYSAERMLAA